MAVDTPDGKRRQHVRPPTKDGFINAEFVCPRVPFWARCQVAQAFAKHFSSALVNCCGRLVLQIDEAKPGEAMRPDQGRPFHDAYWTLI